MLAFFRINDPYRLIGIFLLIVLIRVPFFLGEMPLTIPELQWMIVGETISFKNILYVDVWDDIAPLSALIYSLIDIIGGRTQWGYQILAVLTVFLQCFLFNQLLIVSKAFKENTYVPGLIYAVLMSAFFDFFTLSPALMSCLFQLLVINGIFYHIASKGKDELFLNLGLALGLTALIYLPSLCYLPITIIALGLYSSVNVKKYLLLFFGFLFPVVLVGIYFFWYGALLDFVDYYFLSWLSTPFQEYFDLKSLLIISVPTFLLMVFSWLKIYTTARLNNHQTNYIQVMLVFLVAGFIMVIFAGERVPHQLVVFAAPVAFFLSHLFLLVKRRFIAELVFLLFFGWTLTTNYGVLYRFILPAGLVNYDNLLVSETKWDTIVKGKKILILGDQPDAYLHAYLATPYLNWGLAENHFNQLRSFNTLSSIYETFDHQMPEVIIDQQNLVPELFQQMPSIGAQYSKQGDAYLLKAKPTMGQANN